MAERQGFEPWVGLHPQRFSRPPRSTTPAPLRGWAIARGARKLVIKGGLCKCEIAAPDTTAPGLTPRTAMLIRTAPLRAFRPQRPIGIARETGRAVRGGRNRPRSPALVTDAGATGRGRQGQA